MTLLVIGRHFLFIFRIVDIQTSLYASQLISRDLKINN
jgi:hypothetical protein